MKGKPRVSSRDRCSHSRSDSPSSRRYYHLPASEVPARSIPRGSDPNSRRVMRWPAPSLHELYGQAGDQPGVSLGVEH